ncbi:MAG: UDP-N-acetylmuramate--L-alanine ligase [Acidimicrobiales bacterium]|jgi:UDP-N-acetylmuramate--alanine ligase
MTPSDALSPIDLTRPQRVHVVGVGGAGMSAVAAVLAAMGHEVTGSDLKASSMFQRLQRLGLSLHIGHDPANVAGADALTVSSAIDPSNIEVVEARRLGIPVFSRADVLANVASLRRTIAVAGTHGKTTTASMLSLILVEAGMKPSFIIGGDLNDIGTNAVWDSGEWLVVEADESDRTFLRLVPEVAVVTSVEPDHLETYGSFETLREAFRSFMADAPTTVVSADDATALELAPPRAVTFGGSHLARYRIGDVHGGRSHISFSLSVGGTAAAGGALGDFEVAVPGEYNARNAAAAIAVAITVGADAEAARRALGRFGGVARRFEFRGERNGVVFVDDYAHLPSEVRAGLGAARSGGYERVVCVFQPHRYSRIAALAPDFASAFVDCDVLFVTDVYSAGEEARPGVTGELVTEAVLAAHPDAEVTYAATHEELLALLRRTLRAGDCCITLEAGDLTGLPDELLADDTW